MPLRISWLSLLLVLCTVANAHAKSGTAAKKGPIVLVGLEHAVFRVKADVGPRGFMLNKGWTSVDAMEAHDGYVYVFSESASDMDRGDVYRFKVGGDGRYQKISKNWANFQWMAVDSGWVYLFCGEEPGVGGIWRFKIGGDGKGTLISKRWGGVTGMDVSGGVVTLSTWMACCMATATTVPGFPCG